MSRQTSSRKKTELQDLTAHAAERIDRIIADVFDLIDDDPHRQMLLAHNLAGGMFALAAHKAVEAFERDTGKHRTQREMMLALVLETLKQSGINAEVRCP